MHKGWPTRTRVGRCARASPRRRCAPCLRRSSRSASSGGEALDARLSNLTLRSIRHAAFAHRFLYHSVARTDPARADAIEARAAEDTGWLLATNLGDEPPL